MKIGEKLRNPGGSTNTVSRDKLTTEENTEEESYHCLKEYLSMFLTDFVCECQVCEKKNAQHLQKNKVKKRKSQNGPTRKKQKRLANVKTEKRNLQNDITENELAEINQKQLEKVGIQENDNKDISHVRISHQLLQQRKIFQNKVPTLSSFTCDMCQYKSYDPRILNEHKKVHELLNKIYGCNQCKYKTKSGTRLLNHVNRLHSGYKYVCGDCDFKTKHELDLEEHKQKHHADNCVCKLCNCIKKK